MKPLHIFVVGMACALLSIGLFVFYTQGEAVSHSGSAAGPNAAASPASLAAGSAPEPLPEKKASESRKPGGELVMPDAGRDISSGGPAAGSSTRTQPEKPGSQSKAVHGERTLQLVVPSKRIPFSPSIQSGNPSPFPQSSDPGNAQSNNAQSNNAQQNTGSMTGAEGEAMAEVLQPVPAGAAVPAAFYDSQARTPQQQSALENLQLEFMENVSAEPENPDIWENAKAIADQRYITLFGYEAYNYYHIQAAKDALKEKRTSR